MTDTNPNVQVDTTTPVDPVTPAVDATVVAPAAVADQTVAQEGTAETKPEEKQAE